MMTVELSAESVETADITNRYFTIETSEISTDWELWPNRVILNRGTIGPFYARRVDLPPGSNKIWVGVTNSIGTWKFKIRAKIDKHGRHGDADDAGNGWGFSRSHGGITTIGKVVYCNANNHNSV